MLLAGFAAALHVKSSGDSRPALGPPQFSLRTLLLAVTLLAVVFALFNVLPPMVMAGLIFLLLSIFAHVAGNAIGTRLREYGSRRDGGASSAGAEPPPAGVKGVPTVAPPTQLSQRRSLGWPVLAATTAGLIAGGSAGGLWTALESGHSVAAINIAVGALAFAVLGGLGAFLTFSFAQVGAGALWQALGEHKSSSDHANG